MKHKKHMAQFDRGLEIAERHANKPLSIYSRILNREYGHKNSSAAVKE